LGLFGRKSCPLQKEYLSVYGIQPPRKWTPQDCPECLHVLDGKCHYQEFIVQHQQQVRRGKPATAKKAVLAESPEMRRKAEAEAVRQAGFSAAEEKEYWTVSLEYDRLWEAAAPAQQAEIRDRLDQLRIHLEKGASPAAAAEKVQAWVRQREEFRQGRSSS
jgi:hypothetical protein